MLLFANGSRATAVAFYSASYAPFYRDPLHNLTIVSLILALASAPNFFSSTAVNSTSNSDIIFGCGVADDGVEVISPSAFNGWSIRYYRTITSRSQLVTPRTKETSTLLPNTTPGPTRPNRTPPGFLPLVKQEGQAPKHEPLDVDLEAQET